MGPVAVWSVKGGTGVTSVAAMLAISQVEHAYDTLIVDLCGDMPAVLGLPDPDGPGVSEWCALDMPTPESLGRLEVEVRPGLRLLPRGSSDLPDQTKHLMTVLETSKRHVIVDCGRLPATGFARDVMMASARRLLVMRPCCLNLRRAQFELSEPTGVVVLKEPKRSLGIADIEMVTAAPVVAQIAVDHSIARCIDSGLISARLPRHLLRSLGSVLDYAAA